MKNVQKAPKIPVEPRSDLSATLQAMHSWKCRYPDWSVHTGKISSSVTEGQPAFSYEHIEILVKKREARRDLGNRASPVDRAHMKRS